MRLNLGCGNSKIPGWINIDKIAACNPDQVVDLEAFPWPWPDSSVDEVLLAHVLEHLGAKTETYLSIIRELYRVCRNGATVKIIVPHPRHDFFLDDPTHVRAITPDGLAMFSQKINREYMAKSAANTPLGIYCNVDFAFDSVTYQLDEPWNGRLKRGEISSQELDQVSRQYNNVIAQTTTVLRAVKPAGS
jgi:ubiquinone/menaquinone biosynthesis C-methylase UbiE